MPVAPRDSRALTLATLGGLLLVLPCWYVVRAPDVAPFAGELAAAPERYAGRDVVLPFRRVTSVEGRWVRITDIGGSVLARAGEEHSLRTGESVDVMLRGQDGGFLVVAVGRHATRPGKYLVSTPVLAGVAILALRRLRWDRRAVGLRPAGGERA